MTHLDQFVRSVLTAFARRVKSSEYDLDPALPLSAYLSVGLRRGVALARGFGRGLNRSARPADWVFVGRDVEIRNRHLVRLGGGVTIGRGCVLDGLSRDGITIGRSVNIGPYCIIEATGVITNLGEGFEIGDRSALGSFSFVGAAGGVRVGSDVIMGNRVSFHSENHNFDDVEQPIRTQGVTRIGIVIDDDCWVGANVTFLDGAHVGRGTVVAAGSVVRGNVPGNSVIGGVPARLIRSRGPQSTAPSHEFGDLAGRRADELP